MDIIVIEQTDSKITLAIGLSKDKDEFKIRIAKFDSNQKLYNSLKKHIDNFLNISTTGMSDLYFYGFFKDFTGYSKLLKPIRISRDGRTFYYRDFTKTIEQQKEIMWLVNKCPDTRISYNILVNTIKKKNGIIATFYYKKD